MKRALILIIALVAMIVMTTVPALAVDLGYGFGAEYWDPTMTVNVGGEEASGDLESGSTIYVQGFVNLGDRWDVGLEIGQINVNLIQHDNVYIGANSYYYAVFGDFQATDKINILLACGASSDDYMMGKLQIGYKPAKWEFTSFYLGYNTVLDNSDEYDADISGLTLGFKVKH